MDEAVKKPRKKKLIDMYRLDRFEHEGKTYRITDIEHKAAECMCEQTGKLSMWPIKSKVTPLPELEQPTTTDTNGTDTDAD